MSVYVNVIQNSWNGVRNNSGKTIKSFNNEQLNFPVKELDVTDITEQ